MQTTHRLPVENTQAIALDWHVPEGGEARGTAVFLHGFGSNRRGDKALFFAERFSAQGWNFLSFDMRGHGDSDGSMEHLTLTGCLADTAAALNWLPTGGPPPVLIGSSMGGAVAGWYAAHHPGRIGALVGIAPAFGFPASLADRLSVPELEAWQAQGWMQWDSEWLDVKVGYGLLEDGLQYDPVRLAGSHTAATLIFHGVLDDSVDWRASQQFVQNCAAPRADLVLIKDGDHRLTAYKEFLFTTMFAWLSHPAPGG